MTLYAGEEFRITATGTDFDGAELDNLAVQGVTISIFNADLEVLVDEEPMLWDIDEDLWFFMWDTTGLTAGSYRYRVTFEGLDGTTSWEWKRARLARNPTD